MVGLLSATGTLGGGDGGVDGAGGRASGRARGNLGGGDGAGGAVDGVDVRSGLRFCKGGTFSIPSLDSTHLVAVYRLLALCRQQNTLKKSM